MIPKDCKPLADVDFPLPRSTSTRRGRSAVELWGRGTNREIGICEKHGAPPLVLEEKQAFLVVTFRTPLVAGGAAGRSRTESGDQVEILRLCREERSLIELMSAIGRQNRTKFRDGLIRPLIEGGLLAYTFPGKPRSRVRYRTTADGLAVLKDVKGEEKRGTEVTRNDRSVFDRRVAEDRRDRYWLHVVTNCVTEPQLQEPILDPARLDWHEVTKVAHYYLRVDAMTRPMEVREDTPPYGGKP